MINLTAIIQKLLVFLVFLLPWQTRWIYLPGETEYLTQALYGTEILLGLIVVLALVDIFLSKKLKWQSITVSWKKTGLLLGAFFMIAINVVLADSSALALYHLSQILNGAVLFVLIVLYKVPFKDLIWSLLVSAFGQALLAMTQFGNQLVEANKWLGMALQNPLSAGVPVIEVLGERTLRAFGAFSHPNILAAFLVFSLLSIVALSLLGVSEKESKALPLFWVVITLGLFVTFSRAGILALVIALIVLIIFNRKKILESKFIITCLSATVILAITFSAFFPALILTRMKGSERLEIQSNLERVSQYSEAKDLFINNFPFGVGVGNYVPALMKEKPNQDIWSYQPVHNVFLLLLVEWGLLVVIILGAGAWFCWKVWVSGEAWIKAMILCLFLLLLVDHFWLSFLFGPMFMGLICALMWRFRLEKSA